jgi:hypothetical protein
VSNASQLQSQKNEKMLLKTGLTRFRVFTRPNLNPGPRIVCVNSATSLHETPALLAAITSQLTGNCLLPNRIFGIVASNYKRSRFQNKLKERRIVGLQRGVLADLGTYPVHSFGCLRAALRVWGSP